MLARDLRVGQRIMGRVAGKTWTATVTEIRSSTWARVTREDTGWCGWNVLRKPDGTWGADNSYGELHTMEESLPWEP